MTLGFTLWKISVMPLGVSAKSVESSDCKTHYIICTNELMQHYILYASLWCLMEKQLYITTVSHSIVILQNDAL